MKLLVTGSAGFVGSNVCKEALKQGYSVVGFDIKKTAVDGVESIIGTITDKSLVEKTMRGVDVVINLAAITSNVEFEKSMYSCYNVNVNGFLNLIESAKNNSVKKFAYASSSAVYLDKFSEETIIDISKQKNHYAKSKLMNELIARSYSDAYGLDTLGFRFFNVYGHGENEKGDYASIISIFIKAKRENRPLIIYGDGKQARDFVNVSDVAKIVIKLIEKSSYPLYNIGTGVATSYGDIADFIDKNLKRYVPNPLSSYQYLTRADTSRLISTIGEYRFKPIKESVDELFNSSSSIN